MHVMGGRVGGTDLREYSGKMLKSIQVFLQTSDAVTEALADSDKGALEIANMFCIARALKRWYI